MLTVSLDNLEMQIIENRIGKTGYLLATDASGALVYKPNSLDINEASLDPVDHIDATTDELKPPNLMFNGSYSFVAHTHPYPGIDLLAVLPEQEITEASYTLGITVAAIILVTIALTVICLYLVLQKLVIHPILQFRAMSKEIGRGNLNIENQVKSGDEIGDLASAFEDMARNLRSSDEQIRYVAYHDSLTGLPNRTMFREYLNHVIGYSRRSEKQFALLFLDIDDFKRVNDTLGHQAGDLLLQEVTERLSDCLRKTDYVARVEGFDEPDEILARLGGDEFVILLPDTHDPHAPGVLASRLLKALSKPVNIDGHEVFVGASIGITLYPSDGEEADELIKSADIAMYHAKERGKNDYQYYMESMNELAHERMAVEAKLRKALENNELSLYYQPQVSPVTREVVGLEALLRWHHPEEGFISPGVFIPVAEESGLILAIGEWVMNEACRQNRAWQKAGLPEIVIAVNVSGIQFARQDVADLVRTALRNSGLAARCLEVEITESAIMSQPERAIADLFSIRQQGVKIALDDFGTGYSSFSYLHKFPIDVLKIDRSFVKEIGENEHHTEIVAAMIAMAHILKLHVVAEGIETRAQLDILTEKKCDIVQGFLFKKPVPAEDVPGLLMQQTLKIA
jgi:diguanylate cyclase (GGDEF)-like protein